MFLFEQKSFELRLRFKIMKSGRWYEFNTNNYSFIIAIKSTILQI